MKNIAIFASGSGTNAQKIMDHFDGSAKAKVALVVCNNPRAFVLERAKKYHIPVLLLERKGFFETTAVVDLLKERQIDLIVLAGFLWLIPVNLIHAYPDRIINIHPALLPRYGGKGMYGMRVHEAVISSGDRESGISIHYVNEHYDKGKIIFQARCPVQANDTAETLAEKIHKLEHQFYPRIVERVLDDNC